ncbi:DUF4189 domain-containing protein [Gordonia neofelifaecis]|uniref:DUF4189 domain-containing protein n=1 Tax=Gordonia neofelifaecis NRRL B-59395 TaxID=644548 RepID=F1YKJ7_9ACTN|nr:DUF4189 domain-containing protein [Gordonia neofelifaecis]EGD54641.1 hypothetical protein SCNU_12152 [Gordonia neofelifaecis NRRL B-59395]
MNQQPGPYPGDRPQGDPQQNPYGDAQPGAYDQTQIGPAYGQQQPPPSGPPYGGPPPNGPQYGGPPPSGPQYGQPQYGGPPQYGQPPYGPPPTQPPYGQQPYGQYPGGGQPPTGNGSSNRHVPVIAAIAVLVLLGAGIAVWFGTRGDDSTPHNAAGTSSSAPESPGSTSTPYSTPPTSSPSPSYSPSYPNVPPAVPTTSSTTYYGSIAISRTTGDIGYSINNLTEESAVSAAMSKCGASTCETVLRFWNACGAVAQSQENLYWGWGWAATRQGAIDTAIGQVKGADPKLLTVQCTANAQ